MINGSPIPSTIKNLQDLSRTDHHGKTIIAAAHTVARTLVEMDLNLEAYNQFNH